MYILGLYPAILCKRSNLQIHAIDQTIVSQLQKHNYGCIHVSCIHLCQCACSLRLRYPMWTTSFSLAGVAPATTSWGLLMDHALRDKALWCSLRYKL